MTDLKRILQACDHTLLDRCATKEDVLRLVDEGIKYGTASVCIPPCYVKVASEHAKGGVKICTVVGFPNGYSTKQVKAHEASLAVLDGADEIDTVINLGQVKAGRFSDVLDEINFIKSKINGKILKVIIETCLLSEDEKTELCKTVSLSDADFIKTSTGFSTGGATLEDVRLMARHIKNGKKIKASGGISSLEDAEALLNAGADRLGTSKIVKLAKSQLPDSNKY